MAVEIKISSLAQEARSNTVVTYSIYLDLRVCLLRLYPTVVSSIHYTALYSVVALTERFVRLLNKCIFQKGQREYSEQNTVTCYTVYGIYILKVYRNEHY